MAKPSGGGLLWPPGDASHFASSYRTTEYGGHRKLPNGGHAAFEMYYGRNMVRDGQAHHRLYEIWQS